MEGASDYWYVQLSDGDVHRVTLDQLDEGFQAGHIDGNTMVLPAGASCWAKLGEIAGIDDVPPPKPPPKAPPPRTVVPLLQPVQPAEPPRLVIMQPPHVVDFAPALPLIESHRPVSVDLGDLEFVPGLPRRSRKTWVLGLMGVAMLGALAGVAVERPSILKAYAVNTRTHVTAAKAWLSGAMPGRLFRGQTPAPPAAAASPPVVEASILAPPTAAPPPAEPAPAVAPPAQAPAPEPAAAEPKPQGRALGSKARPRKAHAKAAGASEVPSKVPSSFTTKGNKFDPLSSSIQ